MWWMFLHILIWNELFSVSHCVVWIEIKATRGNGLLLKSSLSGFKLIHQVCLLCSSPLKLRWSLQKCQIKSDWKGRTWIKGVVAKTRGHCTFIMSCKSLNIDFWTLPEVKLLYWVVFKWLGTRFLFFLSFEFLMICYFLWINNINGKAFICNVRGMLSVVCRIKLKSSSNTNLEAVKETQFCCGLS